MRILLLIVITKVSRRFAYVQGFDLCPNVKGFNLINRKRKDFDIGSLLYLNK